jgi:hypothetical protein
VDAACEGNTKRRDSQPSTLGGDAKTTSTRRYISPDNASPAKS